MIGRWRIYHKGRKEMLYGGDEKFYLTFEGKVLNDKLEDITQDVVLMGFSGHVDKRKTGVWEGDLLKDEHGKLHQVKFESGSFVTSEINNPSTPYFMFKFESLEVVGNVWQNADTGESK